MSTQCRVTIHLDKDPTEVIVSILPQAQADRLVQILKQHNSMVQADTAIKPVDWTMEEWVKRGGNWIKVENG